MLPGDQRDLDPDQWVMKLLVKLLRLEALSSMDKTRSTIKVESRTSTTDQQVNKVTTTTPKTLWFLLQLQVLLMELKLKETWIGARGNEASLPVQMMVAEGGDTDVIRVGAVVGAVVKVQPPPLLRLEQQVSLLLNMKRGSNVRGKRRKNVDVSLESTGPGPNLLTRVPGQEAAERASYGQDPYAQQQYQPGSPPPAAYPIEGQQPPYYPPPPGQEYPGATPAPAGQIHPDYGYQPQTGYTPPVPDTYSPNPGVAGYPPQPREPRRADENVSAETFRNTASNDVPLNPNNDALSLPSHDAPLYDSNGAPFYYEPKNILGEGG